MFISNAIASSPPSVCVDDTSGVLYRCYVREMVGTRAQLHAPTHGSSRLQESGAIHQLRNAAQLILFFLVHTVYSNYKHKFIIALII